MNFSLTRPKSTAGIARFTPRSRRALPEALIGCVLLLCVVPACQKQTDTQVLARVGDHEIRVADFEQERDRRLQEHRPLPPNAVLLDEMIQRRVLLMKAERAGLTKDPEVQRTYENILIGKLKSRELEPDLRSVQVSAAEVRARYEQEQGRYQFPAKARVALLFLGTNPKMPAERLAELRNSMEEARRVALQLPTGTRGFGALAINYSEEQASRYRGGDIGWIEQGADTRWPAAVMEAVFGFSTNGEISPVITTDRGLFLVMRTDYRGPGLQPLDSVEASIRQELLSEKRARLEENFKKNVREVAAITVNQKALASIQPPAMATASNAEPKPPAFP